MILVTGGAGFIGTNFIRGWLARNDEPVINLDLVTYAGNPANLASLGADPRYRFQRGDIADRELVSGLLRGSASDGDAVRAIVHFAAESHVDRSIHGPEAFVHTNVVGTFRLLEAARDYWSALPPAGASGSGSSMSPPTRSMDRSPPPTRRSVRPTGTSPTAPIRPARRRPTIWCAATTTPTDCRW